MPTPPLSSFIKRLQDSLARRNVGSQTDADLLQRFLETREQSAFEVLVWRHGALVLGVCRRMLRQEQDVEDAFQATFLLLFQKATAIGKPGALGPWLYKVANRVCLRLVQKRAKHACFTPLPADLPLQTKPHDLANIEIQHLVDDEINRLPERYRVVIVRHYFQGQTCQEIAGDLSCSSGAVALRLLRARACLRRRLHRRDIGLPFSFSAFHPLANTPAGVVPAELVHQTLTTVSLTCLDSTAAARRVAALSQGVLHSMLLTKVKIVVTVLVGFGLLGVGSGVLARHVLVDNQDKTPGQKAPAAAVPTAQPPGKVFEPGLGYAWLTQPMPFGGNSMSPAGQVVEIFQNEADGALSAVLTYPSSAERHGNPEYRPVAYDAQRQRYVLQMAVSCSNKKVSAYRYRLDPKLLAANKVKYVGVEKLIPEGDEQIARHAAQEARRLGIEVLPIPELNKPYEFTLTTVEGAKVSSRDLRGKVVLVDCWATWCSPCMAKMPKLKELYARWHHAGFEVVGINFDDDLDKLRKARDKHGLLWAEVQTPKDPAHLDLFQQAAEIQSLPRLFIIDRAGVLRADCLPNDLEKELAALIKPVP